MLGELLVLALAGYNGRRCMHLDSGLIARLVVIEPMGLLCDEAAVQSSVDGKP